MPPEPKINLTVIICPFTMEGVYRRYPVEKGQIRLLTVQRTPSTCHFQIVRQGDHDIPTYTAISYAWGDPTPVPPSRFRFSDGGNAWLLLSQTPTDLFQSLFQDHSTITVWVDAICINQDDKIEKGIQVDQMGEVYSQAGHVLVWLGASTPASTAAFRFMQSKRGLSWPDGWNKLDNHELQGLDAVFMSLERPWFVRLWVVQEVALSPDVLVACGDDRIGFADFEACVYAVCSFFEGIVDYGEDDAALLGLWSITGLLSIREDFNKNGEVAWERLLQAASQRLATDSRDKIYAFRSLGAGGRPLPSTDYTANAGADKAYTDTAIALLCHGECLDLLALAGKARNGDSSLPSWVPDHRRLTWSEPLAVADGMGWSAGGPFESSPTTVPSFGLRLLVNPIDAVAITCPVFTSWDVLHQKNVLREVVGLRKRFRLQLSERDWLNVLAASLTFGLDIDDQQADEQEYRQYFDEWYRWLMSSKSQSDLSRIKHNKFYRAMAPRIDNWKAFLSDKGLFGIGPPEMAVGDMLCIVPGCRLPLILRPVTTFWRSSTDMNLISWRYLQGIMDGEAITKENMLSWVCLR